MRDQPPKLPTAGEPQRRFGGIKRADIEAATCCSIERKLRERMTIPAFHDAQLGTASIAYQLVKTAAGNGSAVAPILLGCSRPVAILRPSATVRRIVNKTALCAVDAVAETARVTP